jgi:hypothetical protein
VALALAVYDRCLELAEGGVPVERIEEVDLSLATRARDMTPSDGADAVKAIADELLARLGGLA